MMNKQYSRLCVMVTEANLAELREFVRAVDQAEEITVGQTISTWPIYTEGSQRGQITVYHDEARAAVCAGGNSDWGDWLGSDDPATVLQGRIRLDAGPVLGSNGEAVDD